MRGPQQRDALADEGIDVQDFRVDRRLAGKIRERAHPALERVDLADDDLDGLIEEGAIGRLQARLHFFDGEPNRRQRVLHFVRGLARERLPAGDLGEMDQPLAALPQLIGHAVEGVDRVAHLVARRRSRIAARLQPSRPVARRKVGQPFRELLDRPADPMRDEDERRQRDEPRRAEQEEQREREPAPEIAPLDRFHELPRLPELARELLHANRRARSRL